MKIDITSMFVNSKIEGKTATAAWGTSLGRQTFPCALYETPEVFNVLKGMIFSSKTDVENLDVSQMSKNREIILFSLFEKVFVNGVKLDDTSFIMLLVREHTESHDGRLLLSYPKYATYKTGQGIISNADAFDQIAKSLGCGPQGCWFVSDITIANQDTLLINACVVSPNEEAIYRGSSKERSDAWELLAKTNEALSNEIVRKALENDFLAIKNIPEENNELEMVMLLEKWYQKYKDRAVRAFGLKYGRYFIENNVSATSFIKKCSSVPESYNAELLKGINLYRDVEDGKFGLSFGLLNDSNIFINKYDFNEDCVQKIFFGAPGTGKSHEIKKQTAGQSVVRTTFHPDYDYAQFVGSYKPTKDADGKINYSFVPQIFANAVKAALENPSQPIYLVIEEINRGNCAQIFGDIFQLLDRDEEGQSRYSINLDSDFAEWLGQDTLRLPKNFNILATMNTSDQSLFPMDSAFKRRFDWKYVPIQYKNPYDEKKDKDSFDKWQADKYVIDLGLEDKNPKWLHFLKKVNADIYKVTQSEDKQMGEFFVKPNKKDEEGKYTVIDLDMFRSKVLFYLWDSVYKDEVDQKTMFHFKHPDDNGSEVTFQSLFGDDAKAIKIIRTMMDNLDKAYDSDKDGSEFELTPKSWTV